MNKTLSIVIYTLSIFTLGMYVFQAFNGVKVPAYKWIITSSLAVIFLVEIYYFKKQQQ